MGLLGAILGATVSSWEGLWKSGGAIVGGSAAGIAGGAIIGVGAGAMLGDAYITKDGVTQQFSDDDNILLTKSGLTTPQEPARSPDVPPQDDGAILAALGRIESALSRRQTIDLRGGQAFVERNMKNAQDGQVRMGVA